MSQEMVSIEIDVELYQHLSKLADEHGQSISDMLKATFTETITPPYPLGKHPLLKLAGIIDTDQTDLSESVRETMNDPSTYDEYGFAKSE